MKTTKSGYIGLLDNDWIEMKHPKTRKFIKLYRIIALRTFQITPLKQINLDEFEVHIRYKKKIEEDLRKVSERVASYQKYHDGIQDSKDNIAIMKAAANIHREKFNKSQLESELNKFSKFETQTISAYRIGGYVQGLDNIDSINPVWIDNKCRVFDNAKVLDESFLTESVVLYDNAIVRNSRLRNYVKIRDNASADNSYISDLVELKGNATIHRAFMSNSSMAFGDAVIQESIMNTGTIVRGNCRVSNSILYDISQVQGDSVVNGCNLSGRYCITEGKHENESYHMDADLQTIIGND